MSREEARAGVEAKQSLLKKIKTIENIQENQRMLRNVQIDTASKNLSASAGEDSDSTLDNVSSERGLSRLAVLVISVGSRRTAEGSTTNYLARSLEPLIR